MTNPILEIKGATYQWDVKYAANYTFHQPHSIIIVTRGDMVLPLIWCKRDKFAL